MKGVIAEIQGSEMVILDQKGNFKIIRHREGYEVGQEININEVLAVRYERIMQKTVAIAALFIIVIGLGLYSYYSPYSYISLDINPSVEIVLNRYEKVLEVRAMNEDAKAITQNARNMMHKDISYVISELIDEAHDQKYLEESGENEIFITVSALKDKAVKEMSNHLREYTLSKVDQQKINANISVKEVTIEKHEQANEQKVSTGKLVLLEQFREVSPTAKMEDIKDKSVKDIMKSINEKQKQEEKIEKAKRKEEVEKAKQKEEAEKAKQREEAEKAKRKEEAEKAKQKEEVEKAKQKEEAEKAKQKEEAEKAKRKEEVEKAKQKEEAEKAKQKEEAEKAKQKEEAEKAKQKEEAEKAKQKEETEKAKQREEAEKAKQKEEAEKAKQKEEAEEIKQKEEAEKAKQKEETEKAKQKEEAEKAKQKEEAEEIQQEEKKDSKEKNKKIDASSPSLEDPKKANEDYKEIQVNTTIPDENYVQQDIYVNESGKEDLGEGIARLSHR